MNSLSWMIYAADALNNFKFMTAVAASVLTVFFVLTIVFAGLPAAIDEDDRAKAIFDATRSKWWIPFVFSILWVFTPSSNTIYLIAASEAGETIVTSPEAKEVFSDLMTILKAKVKDQLPKVTE